jgi:very-short-patch-repair endonuclease/DNA-directed RNA polymerase subunit RPC12/RpoP
MPINLWTKEEDKILKDKYYEFGTSLTNELNRNKKSIINRAHKLGIKTKITKKIRFCKNCNKKINPYYKNTILCKNCSAKKVYKNRGKFSHNNSRIWINEEIEFLVNNYYDMKKDLIIDNLNRSWSSIMHKANRLNLKRNEKFIKDGNKKGREWFKNNNPMKNKIFKEKALKKQALIFSKTSMTSIEKKIANFLYKLGISYQFNKYIKTKNSFRFPDFTIGNLIIECDGEYWHRNRKQEDYERQLELEDIGYRVIRFTDKEIINNWEFVKQCILLELSL